MENMRHHPIRQHLIRVLHAAFAEGEGLESPSLVDVTSDLTAEQAAWKPSEEPHSIWGIVNHVAAWKKVICRSLDGEHIQFPQPGQWPKVPDADEEQWQQALESLTLVQTNLNRHLNALSDESLTKTLEGTVDWTLAMVFQGLVGHDCYHIGQIVRLRQMQGL